MPEGPELQNGVEPRNGIHRPGRERADAAIRQLPAAIEAAERLGLDTTAAQAALESHAEPAARRALVNLAAAAGIAGPVRDLVSQRIRRRAIDESVSRLAAILDMDGLEAGAIAATQARATSEGRGPFGRLAAVRGATTAAVAPPVPPAPAPHLRAWRERGELSSVIELVRGAIDASLPGMAPQLRPGYAAAFDGPELESRLAAAIDRLLEREAPETDEPPVHAVWRRLGKLQWLNLAILTGAAAWTVLWLLGAVPAPSYRLAFLPFLGALPLPPVLLVTTIVVAGLLLLVLHRHADREGQRWARRLEVVARIGARNVVESQVFARIDRLESARLRLAEAVVDARSWSIEVDE